ncbi:O-antigen ligase family protein [Billgrantia antri]|uniref:O-antigen ligase family protein n=1 Tax=Billgrantia antri TaxID=2846777 RepID=UPI003B212B30
MTTIGRGLASAPKTLVWGFVIGVLVSLDVVNVSYIGYHFKLSILLFFLLGMLVLLKNFVIKLPRYFFLVAVFLVLSLTSSILAKELLRGTLYVVYTFIVLYLSVVVVYTLSKENPKKFFQGYIYSLVAQIFIAVLLVLLGIHDRAQFLYYEPSYFALALTPLFAFLSLNAIDVKMLKPSTFVYLLSVFLFFFFSKSANGLLILFLSFFVVSFLTFFSSGLKRKRNVFLSITAMTFLAFFIAAPALVYLRGYGGDDLLLSSLQKLIFSSDKLGFLVERAGNRLNRILLAMDVFKDNAFVGVGPGNYINYIKNIDHNLYGVPAWLNPYGLPAINMYIEVAAATGVFGLFAFLLILVSVIFGSVSGLRFSAQYLVLFASIVVFLVAINFESSYLRLYFWAWVGMLFSMKREVFQNRLTPRSMKERVELG